jgi:hypothetical protein
MLRLVFHAGVENPAKDETGDSLISGRPGLAKLRGETFIATHDLSTERYYMLSAKRLSYILSEYNSE